MVRTAKKNDIEKVLNINIIDYILEQVNVHNRSLWECSDDINEMLIPHNRSVSRQTIWNYMNHAGYPPRTILVKDDFIL